MNEVEESPRRRRRPPLSCIICRRRKIKCDRNVPCNHCISAGAACSYRPDPRIRSHHQAQRPPSTFEELTPASSDSSRSQDRLLTTPGHGGADSAQSTSGSGAVREPRTDPLPNVFNSVAVDDRDSTRQKQSHTVPRATVSESTPISLQNLKTTFRKPNISHQADSLSAPYRIHRYIAFFQEVTGDGVGRWFGGAETRTTVEECRKLLHDCKIIARDMKSRQRPTRRFTHPDLILSPPSRALADQMAKSYFDYFESTHRVLHAPSFWAEYETYWSDPNSATISVRFKILLVVAIGSSVHEKSTNLDFRSNIWQWVYATQTWLSGPLEKDRVNTEAITIHCLLILARQILGLGIDLIWASAGSLVHRAFQVGLHRDPKYLPEITVLQAEIRRRLWATILEIVLQASLDAEMPPRISLAEFDAEPPANVSDDAIDDSTTVLNVRPSTELTEVSIQLLLLRSVPTRLQILTTLYSIHSELYYKKILELHADMLAALKSCELLSSIHNDSIKFHRNMLDFMLRRFMLHLHAPFALRGSDEALFHFSRKVCLDTALTVVSPEDDENFDRLLKSGAGLFKASVRLAGITISLELIALTCAQREDLSLRRTSEYRQHLKRMMSNLLALAEHRIRCGESNVKDHMVFATGLAEAEAIESGTPIDVAIAKSAKTSLESGYNILLDRYGIPASTSGEVFDADMRMDFRLDDGDFDMWSFLQYTDFQ